MARRGQAGIAMLEVLIALLILGIVVGGLATASITAGGLGKRANDEARLNVLMTAFAEAVKALPYEVCANHEVYQAAFVEREAQLPDEVRALAASGADLQVVSVPPGPECPGTDTGVQQVQLRVIFNGETLERTLVKRTSDSGAEPLDFCIVSPVPDQGDCAIAYRHDPGLQISVENSPEVLWGLKAAGTSRIFRYQWWCDGDWAIQDPPVPPVPADFEAWDADAFNTVGAECSYLAPSGEQTQRIALMVEEEGTGRVGITSYAFTLPTTLVPHQPPVAQITMSPMTSCPQATPCLENTEITFTSTGLEVHASIRRWEWDLGDGTPVILCEVSPSDPTGAACRSQVHSFLGEKPGGGAYFVRLRVTDTRGISSTWAQVNVFISGPEIVRPTVNVNSNLSGVPALGVAPQPVQFNASGSHADGFPPGVGAAAGIANYQWDYGVPIEEVPENLRSGPNLYNPVFTYNPTVRTTYQVRVTVTDFNGMTNFATMSVTVDPLVPPINIRNNGDKKADIPLFRNARFDFQWVNPPAMPGDLMETLIYFNSAGGFCGFFGGSSGPRLFTFTNGPPGQVSSFRAQFSSSPAGFNGVCSTDTFTFYAVTRRTTPHGVFYSPPSPPQQLNPEFF